MNQIFTRFHQNNLVYVLINFSIRVYKMKDKRVYCVKNCLNICKNHNKVLNEFDFDVMWYYINLKLTIFSYGNYLMSRLLKYTRFTIVFLCSNWAMEKNDLGQVGCWKKIFFFHYIHPCITRIRAAACPNKC